MNDYLIRKNIPVNSKTMNKLKDNTLKSHFKANAETAIKDVFKWSSIKAKGYIHFREHRTE